MNTYSIGHELGIGYYIVEQGVRLPMTFTTAEAALQQVDMLKALPLTRDEILDVVAEHIVRSSHNTNTRSVVLLPSQIARWTSYF
jgi:hypothetical protein